MKIVASLLNADFACLGNAAQAAYLGGASALHFDITDGGYVHTLTFGPKAVSDMHETCSLPIEVHLETEKPLDMIQLFQGTGASIITVQADCCKMPLSTFRAIRAQGAKIGLSIHVCEDIGQYRELLHHVDQLLLMSVEPGFGGQPLYERIYQRIKEAKDLLNNENLHIPVGVDGGVNIRNIMQLKNTGLDYVVVGSAIFETPDIPGNLFALQKAMSNHETSAAVNA